MLLCLLIVIARWIFIRRKPSKDESSEQGKAPAQFKTSNTGETTITNGFSADDISEIDADIDLTTPLPMTNPFLNDSKNKIDLKKTEKTTFKLKKIVIVNFDQNKYPLSLYLTLCSLFLSLSLSQALSLFLSLFFALFHFFFLSLSHYFSLFLCFFLKNLMYFISWKMPTIKHALSSVLMCSLYEKRWITKKCFKRAQKMTIIQSTDI